MFVLMAGLVQMSQSLAKLVAGIACPSQHVPCKRSVQYQLVRPKCLELIDILLGSRNRRVLRWVVPPDSLYGGSRIPRFWYAEFHD